MHCSANLLNTSAMGALHDPLLNPLGLLGGLGAFFSSAVGALSTVFLPCDSVSKKSLSIDKILSDFWKFVSH